MKRRPGGNPTVHTSTWLSANNVPIFNDNVIVKEICCKRERSSDYELSLAVNKTKHVMPPKKKVKKKIPIPPDIQPYYKDALLLGLTEQTFQVLLKNGYNNIATISAIDEPDLQALEIPLAQKSVLRRLVKGLQTETAERRTQPEVTAHVSYKREVKTQDKSLNLSTEIYESSQSTLVSTTSDNQDHKGIEFESQIPVERSTDDRFRPEIVIISTDDEDESLGSVCRVDQREITGAGSTDDRDECQETLNRDDKSDCIGAVDEIVSIECPGTEIRNAQVDCIETVNAAELDNDLRTLDTSHLEAGHNIVNNNNSLTDTVSSCDHEASNLYSEEVETNQHDESSSDSDVEQTYNSSTESDSGSDIDENKGLKHNRTAALALRNRAGYRPQRIHGQLARKQDSGYGMQVSRKSKSIQSKNTYVKGASGCIIGDNINITHNQMKEDVDIRIQTLEEQTRITLENYEEEEVFVPTESYKQIKEELESSYFITVTGRPGDGKTTIAIRLLIEYSKNKRTSFICQTPENWEAIAGLKGRKVAVMVDDVFGTYVYDEMKSKPWISRFENMERVINGRKGDIYIIFTSRLYIIQEVKSYLHKFSFFKSQFIINLSDKEFKLSMFEKEEILKKYLQFHKYTLDEETIAQISHMHTPHGFPHCAKLFTTSFFLYKQGLTFFEHPIECLNSEIEMFRLIDKNKFCALALMAVEDGKLTESILNDMTRKSEKIKTLIRVCGLPDNTPLSVLKDALMCMLSVYVRQNHNGSFVFNHETVSEAVCFSLSNSNLEFVLQNMDLKFVNKRIKTQAWKQKHGKDDSAIYIPCSMYLSLWRRFYAEFEKGNVREPLKHQAWEDREFLKLWPSVKTENKKFLVEIAEFTDQKCLRSVFYWAVFFGKEQFVEVVIKNVNVNVEELSRALVIACMKEISVSTIQKMVEKKPELEYKETAADYTKNLKQVNSEYDPNDDNYSDVSDFLNYLFGERMASVILNGGITPLQGAIFSKKLEVVILLIKCGSKIDTEQNLGKTALHFASAIDDLDIQTCLLEHLSSDPSYRKHKIINCTDRKGRTALHYAKSKDMVLLLIKSQANPNLRDIYGHTPLLYRAKFGITSDIVEALCKDGNADINAVDKSRRNVLHIAFRTEISDDIVKCLIKMAELGFNFNSKTFDGETPLMAFVKIYAFPKERDSFMIARVIQTLAECGADLNAVDSKGKTALHHSIDSKKEERQMQLLLNGANPIVASWCDCPLIYLVYRHSQLAHSMDLNVILSMMIKYMPDINYSNKQGENLLHILLKNEHLSSYNEIAILLQKGIDVTAKNFNGVTPIMMAARSSCEMIELLYEHNAALKTIDNKGRNALFYVACTQYPKLDIIDYLLEKGFSLNDCDKDGETPLCSLLSSKYCTVEVVGYFISRGANVRVKDTSENSVFHHLFSNKGVVESSNGLKDTERICETLLEHGADLNSVDNEGNTPLMHSCKNKFNSQILKYLFSRKDVNKININKEGQNILHLIVNANGSEKDKISLIGILQEQEFDFDMVDNFSKSPLIYAIEKNYLSLTLKLLPIANVFDDDKSVCLVLRSVIESGLPNKLLEEESFYSEMERTPEQLWSILSDEQLSVLMRLFSESKTVIMEDGTEVPHFLVKSKIKDDILDYIFSLIIIKQRASLTVTDKVGRTVLHFAVQYFKGDCRRINIVRLLLHEGANPNHRDIDGRTVLHYCVQSGRGDNEAAEIMKCLLDHGGDPFLVNKKGKSTLDVIKDNISRLRTFKFISEKFKIPAKIKQIVQWKVLRSSALEVDINESDRMYITDMLLETWSYDYFSDNKTKLIHLFCRFCNFKIASSLCLITPNVDIKDAYGKTPLQLLLTSEIICHSHNKNQMINKWSTYYDRIEYLQLMGSYTLENAVSILKMLLQRSADPNIKDAEGNTALHLLLSSSWYGKYLWDAVVLLLQYGTNVNAVNCKGITPLMLAAGHKRIKLRNVLIFILMKSGALAFAKDADGHDALWYSQQNICEYVRISSHNILLESIAVSTEIGQALRHSFEMSMPMSVRIDDLCSGERIYEWL